MRIDTEIIQGGGYLSFFAGGLPASSIFKLNIDGLREIQAACATLDRYNNPAPEVAFIALLSYFEGYCKDHLASLINICPQILHRLEEKGQLPEISPADLVHFGEAAQRVLGFLVTERMDLGVPKKINAVFGAALDVTPFSSREKRTYERYLEDRNLLVHHGGNLILRYVRQQGLGHQERERVYLDSLPIASGDLVERLVFVEKLVLKTSSTTQSRLRDYVVQEGLTLSPEATKALESLGGVI